MKSDNKNSPYSTTSKGHDGECLRDLIAESKYTVAEVSQLLGLSRGTLYGRFKKQHLKRSKILQLASIAPEKFARAFPEVFEKKPMDVHLPSRTSYAAHYENAELHELRKKYYVLLEMQNRQLKLLVRVMEETRSEDLRTKIQEILKDSSS